MAPTRHQLAVLVVTLCAMPTVSMVEGFLHDIFPQENNHPTKTQQPQDYTMVARPDLNQLTNNQANTQLKIQFIVENSPLCPPVAVASKIDGADSDGDEDVEYYYETTYEYHDYGPGVASQLAVNGLVLKLQNEIITAGGKNQEHPPMPGYNGRHPQLSSGPRRLEIVNFGQYVNLSGVQHVQTVNGCWEMCWRDGRPGGKLIFGFDVKEEYHRNEAWIPKGRVYLSFPIFTNESLENVNKQKDKAVSQRQQYLDQRDIELERCDQTSNVISKVYHLYKAFAAVEKYNSMPHEEIDNLPSSPQKAQFGDSDDTIGLKDNVRMGKTGVLYFTPEFHIDTGVYDPGLREYEILGTAKIAVDTKAYSNDGNTRRRDDLRP